MEIHFLYYDFFDERTHGKTEKYNFRKQLKYYLSKYFFSNSLTGIGFAK